MILLGAFYAMFCKTEQVKAVLKGDFCIFISPKIEANYILFIKSSVSAVWLMTSWWLTVCFF